MACATDEDRKKEFAARKKTKSERAK